MNLSALYNFSLIVGIVLFSLNLSAQIQLGVDITSPSSNEPFRQEAAMSSDGNVVAVGADAANGNYQVLFYEWDGVNWQSAKAPILGYSGDSFSEAISLNKTGDIVAIGAPQNDSTYINAGKVSIYQWQNNQWVKMGNDLYGDIYHANFGSVLELNSKGDRLAVSSPWGRLPTARLPGDVKVYEYNGTKWVQLGQTIIGVNPLDVFGVDLDFNAIGDRFIVGARDYDLGGNRNIGLTRVYDYDTTNQQWQQLGIDILGNNANDNLGTAVTISGDGNVIATGCEKDSANNGFGYIKTFEWQNNSWVSRGTLLRSHTFYGIGRTVDLNYSGNKLFTSPSYNSFVTGAILLRHYTTTWSTVSIINGVSNFEQFGLELQCDSAGDRIMCLSIFPNDLMRVFNVGGLVNLETVDLKKESEATVYPNPFAEAFKINSSQSIESIEVYDVRGQLVFSRELLNSNKIENIQLKKSGLHFCKLTYTNGKIEVLKVVKQ